MFAPLREERDRQGCRDRQAGIVATIPQDSAYLSGYFADRPRGLEAEVQYFATI